MKSCLKKYWFFVGIAIVILCALNFPTAGAKVKEWNVLNISIALAFLVTGLKLDTRSIVSDIRNFRAVFASLVSSFVLFPAIAFGLAKFCFDGGSDFIVGACILAVVPVTIASGTIITGMAGGNIPLSLFICVVSNFLAIFTIPFSLNILMQFGGQIELPVLNMIRNLVIIVLLPTIIGQLLRVKLKTVIKTCSKGLSVFSQLIVLLIIFNAFAASANKISQLGFAVISAVIFAVILHALILLLNFVLAKTIRLNTPSTSAFTIHTSQKTLTISSVIWSTYFAHFPLALVPTIVYHLVQMVADTFIARRFKASAEKARSQLQKAD